MISERQKLIDRIYTRALELGGDERSAYIDASCSDAAIRREVLALLAAATSDRLDRQFDSVRERLWSHVVSGDESAEEDLAGQRVGHWLIVRRLARGGLATVYLAQRDDGEFDQGAAFKVLRRGLDTDDVVARFRAERQILSQLDHPSIAQILDGGALPDGRPYLVLEYVDGQPITAYCDERNVGVRGRVKLIIDVLRALHHAHRHTIVHRDIKPSNILVSAEGNVVLLDFGIAKLLDPDVLPGMSNLTRTGVSLLTPGYGSPEQRAGQAVTTASDIYQAGVVLYELLAGSKPQFTGPDGQAADAGKPSRHLAGRRRFREVRGDLDAIVQMAMQADPARRYGSASEMVADLERYLDGRPVSARPDTLGYRLGKLTRRRPWLLPVAAIAFLGIAAYVVTLTLYSARLRLEEQRAEAAQAFMVDLLKSPDPFAPADPERGRDITVIEALDLGRARLESELADQPELRASLLGSVARVYGSLDQDRDAIELGEDALALNVELYGEQSDAVLETLRLLASLYDSTGDHDRAANYVTRQLETARSLYSADDPRLGVAEVAAGTFRISQGDVEAGLDLLASGIGKQRAAPGPYAETLQALQDYGETMNVNGNHAGSEAVFRVLLPRLVEQHGEIHRSVADNYQNLATTITYQGRYDDSLPLHRKAYEIYKAVLDDGQYIIAFPLLSIASIEIDRNNPAAAEAAAREALERLRATVPDTYLEGVALCFVGLSLEQQGDAARGSPLVEASHALLLKRDELVPQYRKLCRVPQRVSEHQM